MLLKSGLAEQSSYVFSCLFFTGGGGATLYLVAREKSYILIYHLLFGVGATTMFVVRVCAMRLIAANYKRDLDRLLLHSSLTPLFFMASLLVLLRLCPPATPVVSHRLFLFSIHYYRNLVKIISAPHKKKA